MPKRVLPNWCVLVVTSLLAACDPVVSKAPTDAATDGSATEDSGGGANDSAPPDALPPFTGPLGLGCSATGADPCPTPFVCLFAGSPSSPSEGFCGQPCDDTADPMCADGYEGPGTPTCGFSAGGALHCFVACSVSEQDCPPDLSCFEFPGLPGGGCAGNDGL